MNATTITTSREAMPAKNKGTAGFGMGQVITTTTAGSARATQRPIAHRRIAALVGLLFLAATVTFAIGSALIHSYFTGTTAADGTLIIGVLLLGATGPVVAANGLAMRPVLTPHAPIRAHAYLVLRLAECLALLAVGVYFLSSRDQWHAYVLAVYVPSATAGLVLSSALLTSRLVPHGLSLLGIAGYTMLLLGVVLNLLGITDLASPGGYAFLVPGGLFELALALLLIARGFDRV